MARSSDPQSPHYKGPDPLSIPLTDTEEVVSGIEEAPETAPPGRRRGRRSIITTDARGVDVYTRNKGMPLATEMRAAFNGAPDDDQRRIAVQSVIEQRADEVTVTLAELTRDRWAKEYLKRALFGLIWDENLSQARPGGPLLHPEGIQLRSMLRRDGAFQNIIYKTGIRSSARGWTTTQIADFQFQGGNMDFEVECVVDPQTGLFLEAIDLDKNRRICGPKLPAIEALKCLRQYGEGLVRPRWQRYGGRRFDQWIVCEVEHRRQYGPVGGGVLGGMSRRTKVVDVEQQELVGPDGNVLKREVNVPSQGQ